MIKTLRIVLVLLWMICAGIICGSYSCFIYDLNMKKLSQKVVKILRKKDLKFLLQNLVLEVCFQVQ